MTGSLNYSCQSFPKTCIVSDLLLLFCLLHTPVHQRVISGCITEVHSSLSPADSLQPTRWACSAPCCSPSATVSLMLLQGWMVQWVSGPDNCFVIDRCSFKNKSARAVITSVIARWRRVSSPPISIYRSFTALPNMRSKLTSLFPNFLLKYLWHKMCLLVSKILLSKIPCSIFKHKLLFLHNCLFWFLAILCCKYCGDFFKKIISIFKIILNSERSMTNKPLIINK